MKTAPMITHDCKPTLTDRQVIKFCRLGYLELEAAVAPEVCAKIIDFFREKEPRGNLDEMGDACALMEEDWFLQGLVLCPSVIGAIRSLVGANFIYSNYIPVRSHELYEISRQIRIGVQRYAVRLSFGIGRS